MIDKQEIIKKLHDLGDALDRQSTDDLTGGDTCYIAADLIKKLSAECDHLEKQLAASGGDTYPCKECKHRARDSYESNSSLPEGANE